MPKILGNRSGKNNKSSGVFLLESNKIGFAFLWIFYNFLQILQDSAPSPRSRRDSFTNRPSTFAYRPSGRKLDCNWVPDAMAGRGSSIPVRGRIGSAGKGWRSGVGSPRVPFRGLLAAEEQPAAVLGDAGGLWPQGASAPAGWPATLHNRKLGRLQQGCGEV
jgi:hypothetical protein